MKKSSKIFWTLYAVWSVANIALLIMAFNDTFGEFDKSTEKFWPFSIGSPKTYDYMELIIYLIIPLVIFYIYRLVHFPKRTSDPVPDIEQKQNL